MWIDTDGDGLINIHIFRTGDERLAALQFPTAEETEVAYKAIKVQVGVKTEPKTNAEIAATMVKAKGRLGSQ